MQLTSLTYIEGNSKAKIDIKDKRSGFRVEFENIENPEFIMHIGKMLDEFIWTDKTLDDCFKIDTFEKEQ